MEELALLDDQFDKESFSGSREDEKEEEQQEGEHKADTYRDLKKKINAEDIWKATRRTVLKHQAVPVLFGSAVLNRGITQLLDAVNLLLPS
ncbi:elongation factor g c-terminus domain-containing protein, partial [Cystoisospora suis]